jgi:hypothetical protein
MPVCSPRRPAAAALAAPLALAALATPALGGGTVTGGNASLTLVGTPALDAQSFGNFVTDPGGPDWLFRLSWSYRTPLNNTNRVFSSLDAPAESYTGDTATLTYTNAGPSAAGQERFNAVLTMQVIDGATPGVAGALQTLRLTASPANAGPVTYQIFNMIDADANGVPQPNVASVDASGLAVITDPASAQFMTFFGQGAARVEVAPGGGLFAKVSGGAADLSNAVGPVTGDVGAAFQWTVTLAPGATATIVSGFGVNVVVPAPAPAGALLALATLAARRRR